MKQKIIQRFRGYETAQFIRRWDGSVKYVKIYDDFGDDVFMVKKQLGIDKQKEDALRRIGAQKRAKELDDSINNLVTNMTYKNKAVING